jgi:hypothetical protein
MVLDSFNFFFCKLSGVKEAIAKVLAKVPASLNDEDVKHISIGNFYHFEIKLTKIWSKIKGIGEKGKLLCTCEEAKKIIIKISLD